jgi:hypothetical protein
MALEEENGIAKTQLTHSHNKLDGIEVFLAVETARQVFAGMNSGVKLGTQRAAKTQEAIALLCWHSQLSEHRSDG